MINRSFVKQILAMTVGAQVALSVVYSSSTEANALTCRRVFLEEFEESADLFTRSPYSVLLSKDMSLLRSGRYSSESGPQGNMSREALSEQFYFNDESAFVFKMRQQLLSVASRRAQMIQVLPEQEAQVLAASKEQFRFMFEEFPQSFPDIFSVKDEALVNGLTGESFTRAQFDKIESAAEALEVLSRFITEDLVFLRKKEGSEDFVVVGGVIATPTHIAIEPLLGVGIVAIHNQVSKDPAKAKAFAAMINAALGRLFMAPNTLVRRNNLSLENDPSLSMPYFRESQYPVVEKTQKDSFLANRFIRTERQTLRALPESQTVAFAIKPMVYSLGQLSMDPALASAVLGNLQAKYISKKDNPTFVNRSIQLFAEHLSQAQK